jgi:hypothetical protein
VPIGIAIAGHEVSAELTATRGLPGIATVHQMPGQRLVARGRVKPLPLHVRWRANGTAGRRLIQPPRRGAGAGRRTAAGCSVCRYRPARLPSTLSAAACRRPAADSQSRPLSSRLDLPNFSSALLAIGGLGGVLVLFPPFFDMRVTSSQPRGSQAVSTVPDADSCHRYSAIARRATQSGKKLNPLRSADSVFSDTSRLLTHRRARCRSNSASYRA